MNDSAPKAWHHVHFSEVLRLLGVDVATGLAADEVTRRQKEFGPNRVSARRGTPAWLKFLRQLNPPLVYILLVAVGVTASLGERGDAAVMFGGVIIIAIFGFSEEAKMGNTARSQRRCSSFSHFDLRCCRAPASPCALWRRRYGPDARQGGRRTRLSPARWRQISAAGMGIVSACMLWCNVPVAFASMNFHPPQP
ncbi:MAG: cation-transporting P-type ATPase [Opitutaceae bacterium]